MNQPNRAILAALMIPGLVSALSIRVAAADISIRPEPGGKRLLFVEEDGVRTEPGGKRLLFIDGPDIRTEPGGKRVFFIDGDILRPEPGGPILAYVDGRHIRTAPGGKELFYIDGKDIRPDHDGKRLYFVDGEVLSNQQLMAVLSILRPDAIKGYSEAATAAPSAVDAKVAEQPAAVPVAVVPPKAAEVPAAADTSKKEFAGGTYSIAGFHSSDLTKRDGKVNIAKVGEVYVMNLKFTEGDPWQGVAVQHDDELWAAMGPVNTVGLAVYTKDRGDLTGTWMNATGDKNSFGTEDLSGSDQLEGSYKITQAKAPFTGAAYGGTVAIDLVSGKTLDGDAHVYHFAWDLGAYKAQGVGFRYEGNLVAVSSTAPDGAIGRFKIDPNTGALTGYFYTIGKATGGYTLTNDSK